MLADLIDLCKGLRRVGNISAIFRKYKVSTSFY